MRRLAAETDGHGLNELKLSMLTGFLAKILQLDSSECIALNRQGIMINNGHGHYPLSAFGDGYQSVVTWVLDLLSWCFLQGSDDLTNVCGIVLIDEIEQHLHPRWQRNIVQLLTDCFPDVQFVITTHSPLVASGCEYIPVHRLNEREHLVFKPYGWRAEEVYAMMGLDSSRAEGFVKRLEEFQQLDDLELRGHQLSEKQQERFKYLHRELGQVPGPDPIRLMLQLKNLEQYARESANEDA